MSKNHFITFLIATLAFTNSMPFTLHGQAEWTPDKSCIESVIDEDMLKYDVEFLSDSLKDGRGRDSKGHTQAVFHIAGRFRNEGLLPFGDGFVLSSDNKDGKEYLRNVAGMVKGKGQRYIIVAAHYDCLGKIGDQLYPGADSNASGVASLLALARLFRARRDSGVRYAGNIILIAFDGFTDGRAGSRAFWNMLASGKLKDPVTKTAITPSKIDVMIDIDQIGSTLVPFSKGVKNYMIVLGENTLPASKEGLLEKCNRFYNCGLNLHYSYYRSNRFTELFYNIGDRKVFIEHKIPTIYFTSGITDYNNTAQDRARTLDYPILRKRTLLIFRYLEKL